VFTVVRFTFCAKQFERIKDSRGESPFAKPKGAKDEALIIVRSIKNNVQTWQPLETGGADSSASHKLYESFKQRRCSALGTAVRCIGIVFDISNLLVRGDAEMQERVLRTIMS
jgi:hypothetical protein